MTYDDYNLLNVIARNQFVIGIFLGLCLVCTAVAVVLSAYDVALLAFVSAAVCALRGIKNLIDVSNL